MTKSEAASLVALAAASYPGMQERDLKPTAQVWVSMLSDIPFKTAKQAVMKHITVGKYFPTVAEIRAQAKELTKPIKDLLPEEAWEAVIMKIRERTEGYPSPLVQRAVEAVGGLNTIGYTGMSELGVVRAHFMRVYESYLKRDKEQDEQIAFKNLIRQIEVKQLEDVS
jgi:hypothetical protein